MARRHPAVPRLLCLASRRIHRRQEQDTTLGDSRRRSEHARGIPIACALALAAAPSARSITSEPEDLAALERIHGGNVEHCDEVVAERNFLEVFECGDELFEVVLNAVDGVGANVGDGGRFTRVPRADLDGPGQWADHFPARATGPNAESCVACHQGAAIGGAGDGPGPAALNVIRDPLRSARTSQFIQRNTPHLFGAGALQRLAEEMTLELRAQLDAGVGEACQSDGRVDVPLEAKGVEFGSIVVNCRGVVSDAGVQGVDADLQIRPLQWKGTEPSVRAFSRGAEHNELGMQPVELAGDDFDGDGDGVVNELTIPDMTAVAVYLAAQPRPVTELELNRLRLHLALKREFDRIAELGLPSLTRDDIAAIRRGGELFEEIGCEDCHRSALVIDEPTFAEPSAVEGFFDDPFPAGQSRLAQVIRFDLTRDLPDNQFKVGRRRFDLGNFERTRFGGAIVRLYGDLKRHDMGPGLAENVDETGHGASVWLTKELWGVGSSAPYLHDGRATTLLEAILEHGGEGAASRAAFAALSDAEAASVVRFLENLALFFPEVAAANAPNPGRSRRSAPVRPR